MKRNKLYTVNKWNQPAFVDRTYQNIYDGFGTSFLNSAKNAAGSFGGLSGLGKSLGSSVGGAISGIGSAVGGAVGNLIGGGYESGVGNALGSIGKVASVIPGPWGAAISGGLQVLGGGINALWGTKVDEAKLKANQEGTNTLLNFASNANSFDDVKGVTASSNVQDAYSGGVFKKDWAKRKNAEMRKWRNDALAFADRSVGNNIVNLAGNQMSEDLANYAAYGGPINSFGSGALGIMQNDKYLEAINNRTDAIAKNNSIGLGAYTGGAKTFDDGGQLGAAFMDDFSTDPIGAAVRYNRGMEQLAAQREAAAAEAVRELEYADMQKKLAGLETQNQGLQALMAAQSIPSTPEVPEIEEAPVSSSPSVAARTQSSGNSNWDYILDQLQRSGKFNDVQIEGIKYNLQRESGIGQYDGGDNGTARGLAQWRGARIPKDMSLEGQTKYLIDTLSNYDGKLHWIGRKNYEGFMNARTPEEAHYWIARGYERPAQSIVDKVKRDSDMSLRRLNAFGGELGTNGTDWTNGLLYIDEGGSHEDNPLDGVPMGVDAEGIPNLVEEGETVYNDYVFSDRMKVPGFMYKELGLGGVIKKKGKEMSFADASKKLAQESEQRPNDPISQAGLEASLSRLAEVQETERMRKQMKETAGIEEYACGGKMHKYGLGGNMFVGGGSLEWVNGNHKGGNKKYIAAAIDSYLSKHPDLAKAKDFVKYGQAYDAIMKGSGNTGLVTPSRAGKNSDIGRKHFDELVQLGMPKNVAFGIAFPNGEGYSDREGFHSTRKERESLYGELVKGNKAVKNKSNQPAQRQETQPANAASIPQTASQTAQQAVQSQTPAAPAQGSSRRAGENTRNSGRVLSDLKYGKDVTSGNSVLDAIAFNPPTEGIRESTQQPAITDEVRQGIAMDGYTPEIRPEDAGLISVATKGMNPQQDKVPHYDTWMRYAPVFGAGLMSLTDALGLTNNPDYTYADRLEAAANSAGYAPHIEAEPIGDYLRYNPMDIWYEQNALNAQSRATDRALLNSSSPSRAAGLLANGYNSQLASGNLYRQALEYNDAKRERVADFNRRTNMFNSQMGLEADMANARYHQQAQQLGLSGLAQAAAMRDQIDARTGAARAANLSNFFTSLGNIGRENFAMNQINNSRAAHNGYYGDLSGRVKHDNQPSAYGGKIKKRK